MGLTRVRHGAPIMVFVVLFIVFVVIVRFSITSTTVPRVALGLAAAAWFAIGIALRSRAWRVTDTPVTKVRAATVGQCQFSGIAQSPSPQTAPASGLPCVWYRWKLQEYVTNGKNSEWRTVQSSECVQGFWLRDETGVIWVEPRGAEMEGFDELKFPVAGRGRRWRQLEWRLPQDHPAYVLGPVVPAPDATLRIANSKEEGTDFLISEDDKHDVTRRLGAAAWASLLCGVIAAVLVPLLAIHTWRIGTSDEVRPALDGSRAIALVVALAYFGALGCSWLMRVYNRLVAVQNQAQTAWASIEVQQQRRHDLIDNLVALVKQYARYEEAVQSDVATIRACGTLPTDAEVRAATAFDATSRTTAAKLVALAEAYPELHANEQFTKLSATLTDTEDRIALARQFYNEAVNVMRDRRSTFPYLLVARFVKMPSLMLFGEAHLAADSLTISS